MKVTNDTLDTFHDPKFDTSSQPNYRKKVTVNSFEKKAYKQNLDKIKYSGPEYKYFYDLRPLVFFYKFLAKKTDMQEFSKHSNLKLWIPDTVVYNDD